MRRFPKDSILNVKGTHLAKPISTEGSPGRASARERYARRMYIPGVRAPYAIDTCVRACVRVSVQFVPSFMAPPLARIRAFGRMRQRVQSNHYGILPLCPRLRKELRLN